MNTETPDQSAAADRRPAGQLDGSGHLAAIVAPGTGRIRRRSPSLDEFSVTTRIRQEKLMFATTQEIEAFIRDFETLRLPKPRWTHHAHLVVGLWYLTHHSADDALAIVRQRIRAYNEAVGTANTDRSGYHETLTRLFLGGIAAHLLAHSGESLPGSLALLMQSPLARKDWPLSFYSRERLFSVAARHGWREPDLTSNEPGSKAKAESTD